MRRDLQPYAAESRAAGRGVRRVQRLDDDPVALLAAESLDFADICTSADTHRALVLAAAERGLPVVCQKPMAETFSDATEMVGACRRASVPLLINENWRWQTPIRAVKALLEEGRIGRPFRARIRMVSGFPVFANQPFLREWSSFSWRHRHSHSGCRAFPVRRGGERLLPYCTRAAGHPRRGCGNGAIAYGIRCGDHV